MIIEWERLMFFGGDWWTKKNWIRNKVDKENNNDGIWARRKKIDSKISITRKMLTNCANIPIIKLRASEATYILCLFGMEKEKNRKIIGNFEKIHVFAASFSVQFLFSCGTSPGDVRWFPNICILSLLLLLVLLLCLHWWAHCLN